MDDKDQEKAKENQEGTDKERKPKEEQKEIDYENPNQAFGKPLY